MSRPELAGGLVGLGLAQLARLREIPLDLMRHAGTRVATRADAIAVAIEHD